MNITATMAMLYYLQDISPQANVTIEYPNGKKLNGNVQYCREMLDKEFDPKGRFAIYIS